MSSVQQVRLKVAQARVNALGEDFEAGHNQLNFTQDEVERGRLTRRITSLDQELENGRRSRCIASIA